MVLVLADGLFISSFTLWILDRLSSVYNTINSFRSFSFSSLRPVGSPPKLIGDWKGLLYMFWMMLKTDAALWGLKSSRF
jgi:hypothetical protein